jgi:hypothetical protein
MKELKNNYITIKISGDVDNVDNSENIIYVPYIMKDHTEESLKDYNDFMSQYKEEHECCPKCGATGHSTTFMGYILNMDKKEEYKNLNDCKCTKCGNTHAAHERVPSENTERVKKAKERIEKK